MDHEQEMNQGLLSPLETHIVDLIGELSACIGALCEADEVAYPLGEFDQRLLLEHLQVVERYVLAQVAGRAYPDQFRLIGRSTPRGVIHPVQHGHDGDHHDHGHQSHDHEGHDQGYQREKTSHLIDPEEAKMAHLSGRAILGEHPFEHGHEHGEGHDHADEWDWEPLDESGSRNS